MDKERLFNFLKDDLEKLEKNIKILTDMINTTPLHYLDTQKPLDDIDNFLSYWKQHINEIKYDCDRCKDKMRIYDYENGDIYNDDASMPCPDCQE